MREHQTTDAQPPSSGKRLLFYSLILLMAFIVAQTTLIELKSANCEYRYVTYEYRVVVEKGSKTIHDEDGLMEWPDGPSTLWVYA